MPKYFLAIALTLYVAAPAFAVDDHSDAQQQIQSLQQQVQRLRDQAEDTNARANFWAIDPGAPPNER